MQKIKNDVVIWRYMSFEKYVSMLISNALYLSRVDSQLDKHEGFFPKNMTVHPEQRKMIDLLKQITYINCWHMNKTESAAMWTLYGQNEASVAIKSTYGVLKNAVPDQCTIGLVKYYDNPKELITRHPLDLFLRKRANFAHENELRLIYQSSPLEPVGTDGDKQLVKIKESAEHLPGKIIKIDLNHVITDVYVSPESPSWFYDLVVDTNKKFNFKSEVTKSVLYDHPFT